MTELSVQIYNTKRRLSRGKVKYFAFRTKYFTISNVKSLRLFIREIREIKEIKEVREMVSSETLNSLNSLNSLLTFHFSPFTFEAKLRNASTFYKSRAKRTTLFTFQFSLFSFFYYLCFVLCAYK